MKLNGKKMDFFLLHLIYYIVYLRRLKKIFLHILIIAKNITKASIV